MTAYYNEIDPYAAQWLRNLIEKNLIAPGDVDERSIADVRADDLKGYDQCHFFAGIGGWSLALRIAGWPDDRPVWTGSCPCQPYSVASVGSGGAKGDSDNRDLWPVFFPIIRECSPSIVFGEQVPGSIEWGWWDRSALDFESENYAAAALVLRADAVEADHERKRLYWMADAGRKRWKGHKQGQGISGCQKAPFSQHGDPLAGARRALAGSNFDLLPSDGVPVAVERLRAKGYGNAIVPQVAAEFIAAAVEAIETT